MDHDCDRIIVERLHGHWSAWFDGEPQIAFGGLRAAAAVERPVRFATTDDDTPHKLIPAWTQ